MKLIDYIHHGAELKEKFESWEATEQIINKDKNQAIYTLRKPGSGFEYVSLYTDGYFMCIYGDYGTLTFNNMTWQGNIYNLQYDNTGYQMEKLSHESRESIKIYDDTECREDIKAWFDEKLGEYHFSDESEKALSEYIELYGYCTLFLDELFEEHAELEDCQDLLEFVCEAMENIDSYEWISFLRRTNFSHIEEECESDLWHAGERIHQRYYINLLACQVCAEKLIKNKETRGESYGKRL